MKERDFLKNIITNKTGNKGNIRHNVMTNEKTKKGGLVVKKKFAIVIACVVVLIAGFIAVTSIYMPQSLPSTQLRNANYEDIFDVIEDFHKLENRFNFSNYFGFGAKTGAPESDSANNSQAYEVSPDDFSHTNIQTEGVDEGDIVKNDGQYIYKLNTSGCIIVSADQGQLEIVSEIAVDNYIPLEMYIYGDKLIMIGGIYEYFSEPYIDYTTFSAVECFYYMSYARTDIRIYDIASKSTPLLLRQLVIDGNYNTSRVMLEEGKLFYMINYNFYYGHSDKYIPQISDSQVNGGEVGKIPAENIYYYDDVVNYAYLIIGNIDLEDTSKSVQSAFLGLAGTIYVSAYNIYVASFDYYSTQSVNIFGWVKESNTSPTTRIVKIALSDLAQKATGRVYGHIKDRYSMDEYQEHLRIATTVWGGAKTYSMVYVLKPDLTVAGKIDNIAEGESIYSVRFNKDKGSLVTFQQVDPYFNLDLADPANPKISKGLKEDGVSHYIHYIGETNFTIGVGRDSTAISNAWGNSVQWLGLKVSLYDNNSGEAENIKTISIRGQGYSQLFYNPKVLLYDEQRGLFAFAYEDWSQGVNFEYKKTQGLLVFRFNLEADNDEDKLIYAGLLTNLNAAEQQGRSDGYWYNTYLKYITRGVRIGDYIYTISDTYIVSYELDTLVEVDRIVNQKEQLA